MTNFTRYYIWFKKNDGTFQPQSSAAGFETLDEAKQEIFDLCRSYAPDNDAAQRARYVILEAKTI